MHVFAISHTKSNKLLVVPLRTQAVGYNWHKYVQTDMYPHKQDRQSALISLRKCPNLCCAVIIDWPSRDMYIKLLRELVHGALSKL